MTPRVIDLSHHNDVTDFALSRAAGIWGIIHKASEGTSYVDPTYAGRQQPAVTAGLLWAAYHFGNASDVPEQVDHFVKTARPDASMLMVLDYEDNPSSNMSVHQAVEFMRLLEQKIGRQAAIYSGNRLKETIGSLNAEDTAYITSRRFWLAQYGSKAVLPAGFKSWWLWQYTGDGVGPEPHSIAGIKGTGIDLNVYSKDTQAQLKAEWPGEALVTSTAKEPTMTTPTVTAVAAAPASTDPIPGLIHFIDSFSSLFLGLAQVLPAQYRPIAQAAPVVVEEVLQGIEDVKNLSGGNLVQSLLTRIENVVLHGKAITASVSGAAPVAPAATAVAAGKSEGMPNS